MMCPIRSGRSNCSFAACTEICALYDAHSKKCAFQRIAEQQEIIAERLEQQANIAEKLEAVTEDLEAIPDSLELIAERIC
jgi:putative ribosome biogenesis GTPase RsgA